MSKLSFRNIACACLFCLLLIACVGSQTVVIPVNKATVEPGSSVRRGDATFVLLGTPIKVGYPLPSVPLVEASGMMDVDLADKKGRVMLLSIVPSLDTKVCEAQTHYLGEEGDRLPASIERITISRDTPFAQWRFAEEAKLTDITYLSDYKDGAFGRAMGLLVDGPMLLARSILIVDRDGIVRYIQVVPVLTELPDMEHAFNRAVELAR